MKLLKKLQSLFPYVISLSLLVSPFLVRPWVKGAAFYDNQRLLEVFCLLFCLLIIFLKFVTDKSLPAIFNKNIAISLAVFFFCGLLSSAFSFSPRHAYFEVVSFMLLLGTAWLIATEIRALKEKRCSINCL